MLRYGWHARDRTLGFDTVCPSVVTPQLFQQNPYMAISWRLADHQSIKVAPQQTSHLL